MNTRDRAAAADHALVTSGRQAAPAVSDAAPPPFAPYEAFVKPLLIALRRQQELRDMASSLGMNVAEGELPLPDQRTGRALNLLGEMDRQGTLSELSATLNARLERLTRKDVLGAATIMFSTLATPRPMPPNFVRNADLELRMIEASRAAVILAFRDAGISPDRRYGAPEIGEILGAAKKRDKDLKELSAIVVFLSRLAPRVTTLLAKITEAQQVAEEARRRREIEWLLDELRAGNKLWDSSSDTAKAALAAFEDERRASG